MFKESSFSASHVSSLCWFGDALVDWVGGGRAFALDGRETPSQVNYAYRFDAATASPDSRHAVIYEKRGTKGLLLNEDQIVRELNRSFYCADAYEYPVALFNSPDGRLLLAHCPTDYNRLDLEDAKTGVQLSALSDRDPSDFFHSRLAASPSGKRLLSAGWLWHPWDDVAYFGVDAVLANPLLLDSGDSISSLAQDFGTREQHAACWLDDDCLAVAWGEEDADDQPALAAQDFGLAVFDLAAGALVHFHQFAEPLGNIIAVGSRHILSLYRHPKLIEVSTGVILPTWSDINAGLQQSSIIHHLKEGTLPSPYVFDLQHRRFAISNGETVKVITFDVS